MRVGNNPTLLKPGNFDLADLIIRNDYDASRTTADLAYLSARYGL
jgi:hypothetical protein